jgi:hypothetical protein
LAGPRGTRLPALTRAANGAPIQLTRHYLTPDLGVFAVNAAISEVFANHDVSGGCAFCGEGRLAYATETIVTRTYVRIIIQMFKPSPGRALAGLFSCALEKLL